VSAHALGPLEIEVRDECASDLRIPAALIWPKLGAGVENHIGEAFATVWGGSHKNYRETAALFAAAPDMLESLRFARAELVRLRGVVDVVDAELIDGVVRDIDESLAKAVKP
jgi:hypothetical protein